MPFSDTHGALALLEVYGEEAGELSVQRRKVTPRYQTLRILHGPAHDVLRYGLVGFRLSCHCGLTRRPFHDDVGLGSRRFTKFRHELYQLGLSGPISME